MFVYTSDPLPVYDLFASVCFHASVLAASYLFLHFDYPRL